MQYVLASQNRIKKYIFSIYHKLFIVNELCVGVPFL